MSSSAHEALVRQSIEAISNRGRLTSLEQSLLYLLAANRG